MQKPRRFLPIVLGVLGALAAPLHAGIIYETVTVSNAGNAADTTGHGSVGYSYAMGKYEVTLSQYAAFLNAVAATDTYSLYDANMGTNANIKGIAQSGAPGSFTYTVIGSGDRPVTYVSWFDAARMANWIQNGQGGAGTTETGAYTLSGATSGIFTKNAGATIYIPTEDEWYKAGYYDPTLNGGAGGYWSYATRSNSAPGNVVGAGANRANYNNGVYSVTQSGTLVSTQNYLTDVGAFSGSASYYGTYDQDGNAKEWNDAVISGSNRGLRGGSWFFSSSLLRSSIGDTSGPVLENGSIGFRLASVPEPATLAVGLLCLGVGMARRRRSARVA